MLLHTGPTAPMDSVPVMCVAYCQAAISMINNNQYIHTINDFVDKEVINILTTCNRLSDHQRLSCVFVWCNELKVDNER